MGKPYRAIIEGAKMTVCSRCSRLGSASWKVEPTPHKRVQKTPTRTFATFPPKKAPAPSLAVTRELVDDYDVRVRGARESLALSHEELGKQIKEKVSVIRKIESRKMVPDHGVAEKLEHALKVKLLVPPAEPKAPLMIPSRPREVTLGEMIKVKERKAEASKERKQS
jgi:putative transcription factor